MSWRTVNGESGPGRADIDGHATERIALSAWLPEHGATPGHHYLNDLGLYFRSR